jgi:hypothetical protein
MFSTATLPKESRMRAFLEQRVIYNGLFMARACALDLQAKAARERSTPERWRALDSVLALEHEPVDDDTDGMFDVPPDPALTIDEIIVSARYATPTHQSLRS